MLRPPSDESAALRATCRPSRYNSVYIGEPPLVPSRQLGCTILVFQHPIPNLGVDEKPPRTLLENLKSRACNMQHTHLLPLETCTRVHTPGTSYSYVALVDKQPCAHACVCLQRSQPTARRCCLLLAGVHGTARPVVQFLVPVCLTCTSSCKSAHTWYGRTDTYDLRNRKAGPSWISCLKVGAFVHSYQVRSF